MNPTASNSSWRDRKDNDLSLDSLRALSHNSHSTILSPNVIRFLAVTCMPPDSSSVQLRVLDQRIHAETHLASIPVLASQHSQRHQLIPRLSGSSVKPELASSVHPNRARQGQLQGLTTTPPGLCTPPSRLVGELGNHRWLAQGLSPNSWPVCLGVGLVLQKATNQHKCLGGN